MTPSEEWTDTRIDLHSDDVLEITASATSSTADACDPHGSSDLANAGKLSLSSALPGVLLAKTQNSGSPVFVGAERRLKIKDAGRLYLGSNLGGKASCSGRYSVKIHLVPGEGKEAPKIQSKLTNAAQIWLMGQFGGNVGSTLGMTGNAGTTSNSSTGSTAAASVTSSASASSSPLPISRTRLESDFAKQLESLPRRVNDEFNNPGDIVNFMIVGSEKRVKDALAVADWHVADISTSDAITKAVIMATENEDYLHMPMSQLYLFGRVQDFGYKMAEPYAVVANRHHFRIWKAPIIYRGQQVWAGAGTHDIGFEKDQRNGKVTHKIYPAVDGERENIGRSLLRAGQVKMMSYFTPSEPILESKNATGGGFHSERRVLVIFLQ